MVRNLAWHQQPDFFSLWAVTNFCLPVSVSFSFWFLNILHKAIALASLRCNFAKYFSIETRKRPLRSVCHHQKILQCNNPDQVQDLGGYIDNFLIAEFLVEFNSFPEFLFTTCYTVMPVKQTDLLHYLQVGYMSII